jgi:hypothetical protein
VFYFKVLKIYRRKSLRIKRKIPLNESTSVRWTYEELIDVICSVYALFRLYHESENYTSDIDRENLRVNSNSWKILIVESNISFGLCELEIFIRKDQNILQYLHGISKVNQNASYFFFLLTYLLTYSRSGALLEEPPIVQLLKNFPAVYGTKMFNTMFTRALHWSLSW